MDVIVYRFCMCYHTREWQGVFFDKKDNFSSTHALQDLKKYKI